MRGAHRLVGAEPSYSNDSETHALGLRHASRRSRERPVPRYAVRMHLRDMARLGATSPSPMVRGVDMSPGMVAERLHELAEVSALCARLAAARRRD
jgi:hypothetical protein